MSYIIIEEENHPDRLIMRTIGPFDNEDEAYALAACLEESPANIIPGYGTRRYWYIVKPIDNPKDIK